jgi:TolA-binding protein
MTENDEIEQLIDQLKQLQLQQTELQSQQTELLDRLERARRRENNPRAYAQQDEDLPPAQAYSQYEVRAFAVGDKVRITNPNRALFQADRGVIIKVGDSRITVQTKTGKVTRAPKNLTFQNE